MNIKINFKAIIVGFFVDWIGSIWIWFATNLIFIAVSYNQTPEYSNLILLKTQVPENSVLLNIWREIGGGLFTIIGGYVTAYIAKIDEIEHAFILGILLIISGLVFSFWNGIPIISDKTALIFPIPFAILGAYLRIYHRKKLNSAL